MKIVKGRVLKETDRQTDTDRQRETETDRQTETEQRQTEREREREGRKKENLRTDDCPLCTDVYKVTAHTSCALIILIIFTYRN